MFNYQKPKNKNKGQGGLHFAGQNFNEKFGQERPQEQRDVPKHSEPEFDMDGFKHQLAKISAVLAWVISIYFSYEGFAFQNKELLWVGWLLGFLVTCGEFIFNSELKKLSLTLVAIGAVCYGYGVYSNVVGFWSIQYPNIPFPMFTKEAAMSWFVGSILEIYPEAAFAWGMKAMTGDLVGNIAGLAGGAITGQRRTYQVMEEFKNRIGH